MSASDANSVAALPTARTAPSSVTSATSSRIDALKSRPPKPGEASFFYRDLHFQHDSVKVLPGEYFVTSDNMMLMTVLGSCIAACVWDPVARAGGMNHFMLPEGGGGTSGRYGTYAMELLINEMIKLGAQRERMQAKVFGGGQVMRGFTALNVGERNTAFVLDYLQAERIAVVSKDVLDIHPRKVCYFPVSGKAMVKRLAHGHPDILAAQERNTRALALKPNTTGGSVDLF